MVVMFFLDPTKKKREEHLYKKETIFFSYLSLGVLKNKWEWECRIVSFQKDCGAKKIPIKLVGGFKPFEKYARQIGSSPQAR